MPPEIVIPLAVVVDNAKDTAPPDLTSVLLEDAAPSFTKPRIADHDTSSSAFAVVTNTADTAEINAISFFIFNSFLN
jgi:hypothetical protein